MRVSSSLCATAAVMVLLPSIVGAKSTIFSNFLATDPPVAAPPMDPNKPGVTEFILVNAATGKDLIVLDSGSSSNTIDLSTHGTDLTIRMETTASTTMLRMDLDDGSLNRVEGALPFYLAGYSTTSGETFASHSIATVGDHVLTACPATDVSLDERRRIATASGCATVQFVTVADRKNAKGALPTASAKLPDTDVPATPSSMYGTVSPTVVEPWQTVTVGFAGPPASEMGMTVPGIYREPYPCPDYRLDVTFTNGASTYVVPGYYAGNGNAINDGGQSGSVWECKFRPDAVGTWSYAVHFVQGTNAAQNGGGNPGGFFDQATGSFEVVAGASDSVLARGGLSAGDANNYLEFADGTPFLQVGPDSPQNLLAYSDFDNTPNHDNYAKDYALHAQEDYVFGQPTFAGGKGKGLIGALNYLSNTDGVTMVTANTFSDDGNVFPYRDITNQWAFDNSKLAQWALSLDYAISIGLVVRIKLGGSVHDTLDDGNLYEQRKIYYREMVARLGSPMVVWDLGEGLTVAQATAFSRYIRTVDPYESPITVSVEAAADVAAMAEVSTVDGVTVLSDDNNRDRKHRSLAIASSPQSDPATAVRPDSEDPHHDDARQTLWTNLMAGGSGMHYYFGLSFAESDLTLEDFRSRDALWELSRYALHFFARLPVQSMAPVVLDSHGNDEIAAGSVAMATEDRSMMAIYKLAGKHVPTVHLVHGASYTIEWYNPRSGVSVAGSMATVSSVSATDKVSLGQPLVVAEDGVVVEDEDWVILLTRL